MPIAFRSAASVPTGVGVAAATAFRHSGCCILVRDRIHSPGAHLSRRADSGAPTHSRLHGSRSRVESICPVFWPPQRSRRGVGDVGGQCSPGQFPFTQSTMEYGTAITDPEPSEKPQCDGTGWYRREDHTGDNPRATIAKLTVKLSLAVPMQGLHVHWSFSHYRQHGGWPTPFQCRQVPCRLWFDMASLRA